MNLKQLVRVTCTMMIASLSAGCGGDKDKNGITNPAGCGSSALGTFSGTVSGAESATLSGCAYYFVADFGTGNAFNLVLTNGAILEATYIQTGLRSGARPATGTYSYGTGSSDFSGQFSHLTGSSSTIYTTSGGTLTINSSASGTVSGSLNVTSTRSSGTVTVSGTFTAKCTPDASGDPPISC